MRILKKVQRSESWVKQHLPDEYSVISSLKPETWPEKLYWYEHDITKRPTCKCCGKEMTFNKQYNKYKEYCSSACVSRGTRDKVGKTMQDKYGGFYNNREKAKATCIEKYGVSHQLKSQQIREKVKQTNLERYGKEWGLSSDEIQRKIELTNLERYGVMRPLQVNLLGRSEIISFSGREWICKCPHPECTKCEEKQYTTTAQLWNDRKREGIEVCTKLLPVKSLHSNFELKIRSWLDEMGFEYVSNDRRFGTEMDIYIPKMNLAIECNGSYWHSTQFKTPSYHIQKSVLLAEKGVRVVFVWEDYRDDDIKEFLSALIKGEDLKPWVNKWFPDMDGWPADFGLIGSDWKEHKTVHGGFECYDAGEIKKEDL